MHCKKCGSALTEDAAFCPSCGAKTKKRGKKPFFLIRMFKKLGKLLKDVAGEMKKVVWTPKDELKKSTKLVLCAVVAIGLSIAVVDTIFSWIINSVASLIG